MSVCSGCLSKNLEINVMCSEQSVYVLENHKIKEKIDERINSIFYLHE